MATIELRNIVKKFDDKVIIPNLSLTIEDESFTVLIGPSGCGKTTTLRLIAGLEQPDEGEIFINGRSMDGIEPGERDIAMVFQNYALYPTMTVRENIEFGLINNNVNKQERKKLVNEIAEIVDLTVHLDKKPSALSGGQRQRVALARAMVKKPKVFLMDEPLSNLDAKLRAQMRIELSELHKRLKTTFVYVTHDQVEAMSMATDIILMDHGVIQQKDEPKIIYGDPNNIFTAQFIGSPSMNLIEIRELHNFQPRISSAKYIGFRPSSASVSTESSENSHDLTFNTKIVTRELLGSEIIYNSITNFGKVYFKTFQQEEIPLDTIVTLRVKDENIYYFNENKQRMRD